MECLLPYLCMVTVPHIMVGLERVLDYRGVGLERFHCMYVHLLVFRSVHKRSSITALCIYLNVSTLRIVTSRMDW